MTLLSDVLKKRSDVPVVRLANGTNKYEGRVEVLHDGVWSTVCDNGWSRTNGHIVCKELGLGRARHIFMGSDKFGKGTSSSSSNKSNNKNNNLLISIALFNMKNDHEGFTIRKIE